MLSLEDDHRKKKEMEMVYANPVRGNPATDSPQPGTSNPSKPQRIVADDNQPNPKESVHLLQTNDNSVSRSSI